MKEKREDRVRQRVREGERSASARESKTDRMDRGDGLGKRMRQGAESIL